MKAKYFLFIVFLIIGFMSVKSYAQTFANRLTIIAERESGDKFKFSAKTRKGAVVYGVNQPSETMLSVIDKGLDDLFVIARKYNYQMRLRHSDYTIYIAKADRQTDRDGNYSPAFAVSAGQYAGSEYDKGGYIYAAGMVIAYNPCAFLIAEHTKELNRISDIVRYEGEHLVLYHNDRRLYNQTADHSQGGGHPILN